MTIAVIIDFDCEIRAYLVDIPDDATEEDVLRAITKEVGGGWTAEGLKKLSPQRFEIEPSAVEKLEAIQWPDPYGVAPIFADNVDEDNGMYQSRVYAAFAKGGPVKLDYLKDK